MPTIIPNTWLSQFSARQSVFEKRFSLAICAKQSLNRNPGVARTIAAKVPKKKESQWKGVKVARIRGEEIGSIFRVRNRILFRSLSD